MIYIINKKNPKNMSFYRKNEGFRNCIAKIIKKKIKI